MFKVLGDFIGTNLLPIWDEEWEKHPICFYTLTRSIYTMCWLFCLLKWKLSLATHSQNRYFNEVFPAKLKCDLILQYFCKTKWFNITYLIYNLCETRVAPSFYSLVSNKHYPEFRYVRNIWFLQSVKNFWTTYITCSGIFRHFLICCFSNTTIKFPC